jgi:hypothetical protein
MKHKSKVLPKDVVEKENIPGSPTCIFVEADPDLRPVLDYTGAGVEQSYADSRARMSNLPIHGLRVHDADTPKRLKATLAKKGRSTLAKPALGVLSG